MNTTILKRYLMLSCLLLATSLTGQRKAPKTASSVLDNTQAYEGYFDFFYDDSEGRIYLRVDRLNEHFLYVNSLSQGIGSNDIGLDRGQLGNERVVFFKKMGNKLMLVQPNLQYRANTDNVLEKKSIEEAFAKSVLYGFPIVEKEKNTYIIDLTSFLMQDAHGVTQRLMQRKQGSYTIDKDRSAVSLNRTRAFPKNIELDVMLTFAGTPKGRWVRSVTPTPEAVTVYQHHSFIELPDSNYTPRVFDPRSGAIPFTFNDYTTPVNESTLKRYILRHRLEKKDPTAAVSEAVAPILYYLDNGTPEPVRSALLEGGRWWNQAFESIGFKDAFQVKILPDNADPLDIRYNVIQWVHRATRGWSYGASVADPRTGEIIKGHVSLGSLRIRQDFMIALGLTEAPFAAGQNEEPQALEMALARIRQLSAHEIGHTLGFAHNFAASPNNRSSVMDYPHPTLEINEGKISYANAYATGIGSWDKVTVAYAYTDFPSEMDESVELTTILENAAKEGHRFISDQDARPQGGAHPTAHLWDNGASAIEEFEKVMKIREVALQQLSKDHLREGEPYSVLEDRMVPMYLLHRYQFEAAVKLIGGVDYDYAVKGNVNYETRSVAAKLQKESLRMLLTALTPATLSLPEKMQTLIPPRAFGYSRTRENFLSQTGVTFDYLGIAHTLSDFMLNLLLHPQRANRLVQQSGMDSNQLSLQEVLDTLIQHAFFNPISDSHGRQLNEVVKANLLTHLMKLVTSKTAYSETKAIAFETLESMRDKLKKEDVLYATYYVMEINRFFEEPDDFSVPEPLRIPDGSPIGTFSCDF